MIVLAAFLLFVVSIFGDDEKRNLKGTKSEIKINEGKSSNQNTDSYTANSWANDVNAPVAAESGSDLNPGDLVLEDHEGAELMSKNILEAFLPLVGECFESEEIEQGSDKYVYEICSFDKVRQKKQSWSWLLGEFRSWGHCLDDQPCWKFGEGMQCASGKHRDAEILLKCGMENKVISIEEYETCSYRLVLELKAMCKVDTEHTHASDDNTTENEEINENNEINLEENVEVERRRTAEVEEFQGLKFKSAGDRDFYFLKKCMFEVLQGTSFQEATTCMTFASSSDLNLAEADDGSSALGSSLLRLLPTLETKNEEVQTEEEIEEIDQRSFTSEENEEGEVVSLGSGDATETEQIERTEVEVEDSEQTIGGENGEAQVKAVTQQTNRSAQSNSSFSLFRKS